MRPSVFKPRPFIGIIVIYLVFISGLLIYFFYLQNFGSQGLEFSVAGKDHVFTILDIIIVAGTIASLFLLGISLMAFKRKKDMRIFLISLAFFFFALKEFVHIFENFFPNEYIFIGNAVRGLELLILLSFILLMYKK